MSLRVAGHGPAVFLLLYGSSSKDWVLEFQSQAKGIPPRDLSLRRWQPQEGTSYQEDIARQMPILCGAVCCQFCLPPAHLALTPLGAGNQICSHSTFVPSVFQRCARMFFPRCL